MNLGLAASPDKAVLINHAFWVSSLKATSKKAPLAEQLLGHIAAEGIVAAIQRPAKTRLTMLGHEQGNVIAEVKDGAGRVNFVIACCHVLKAVSNCTFPLWLSGSQLLTATRCHRHPCLLSSMSTLDPCNELFGSCIWSTHSLGSLRAALE